jgi:predicted Zn-ribbon and HTH transcriptional regulator
MMRKRARLARFYTEAAGDTLPLMHIAKKSRVVAKVQRAPSVIVHGKHMFLKECKKCGGDFYGVEKQTRCDECLGTRKKHAS